MVELIDARGGQRARITKQPVIQSMRDEREVASLEQPTLDSDFEPTGPCRDDMEADAVFPARQLECPGLGQLTSAVEDARHPNEMQDFAEWVRGGQSDVHATQYAGRPNASP